MCTLLDVARHGEWGFIMSYNYQVKKSKKAVILIAVVAIVAISILIGYGISESNAQKAIRGGFLNTFDERIAKLLDEAQNSETDSYAYQLGLKEVNCEIKKIDKEDDIYVLILGIDCICENTEADEVQKSLLAYDAEKCFSIFDDFHIGKHLCRFYYKNNAQLAYEPLVYTYVNGELLHEPTIRDPIKIKDTVKCEVCGDRYNKGSENAKSIAMTSMCEDCYANFLWLQDAKNAIDNLPVD